MGNDQVVGLLNVKNESITSYPRVSVQNVIVLEYVDSGETPKSSERIITEYYDTNGRLIFRKD